MPNKDLTSFRSNHSVCGDVEKLIQLSNDIETDRDEHTRNRLQLSIISQEWGIESTICTLIMNGVQRRGGRGWRQL